MEGLFSPYFVLKYINLHLEIISDIQSHQFIKYHNDLYAFCSGNTVNFAIEREQDEPAYLVEH